MLFSFKFIELAARLLLPLQTVWLILNLKRNSKIQHRFAFRAHSCWLTRIRGSLNAVSSNSLFYTFDSDHIEEKIPYSFGFFIVGILETIVKLFITETMRFCVEIKIEQAVLAPKGFHLKDTNEKVSIYLVRSLFIDMYTLQQGQMPIRRGSQWEGLSFGE